MVRLFVRLICEIIYLYDVLVNARKIKQYGFGFPEVCWLVE